MEDKELMELSAIAMGGAFHSGFLCVGDNSNEWNPLTDDGDRYRLAVKTRLFSANRHRLECWISSYMLQAELPYDQALAIAIVRAAAEIGRAMK